MRNNRFTLFLMLVLLPMLGRAQVNYGFTSNAAYVGEINWSVPTNEWPDKLWTYKVIPQEFSPSVISNLLATTGFTETDRSEVPDYVAEHDKRAMFFGELEGTCRHLAISPALGLIEYHDGKAESSGPFRKVEGVPNEQETTQLGLEYLRLLGIEISQIARNPTNGALDLQVRRGGLGYIDQSTKQKVSLTNNCEVSFARSVDGIKVRGFGGMDVRFGNNRKLVDLQVCWRNLQPYQLRECPTLQEIAEQITAGKIVLYHLGGKTEYPVKQLRKLTITMANPFYEGKYWDQPMDFVRPYASFQAVAEDGQTKSSLWFVCSLVSAE